MAYGMIIDSPLVMGGPYGSVRMAKLDEHVIAPFAAEECNRHYQSEFPSAMTSLASKFSGSPVLSMLQY